MTDTNKTSGADVLAVPRECRNCGGTSLSWDVSNRNNSGVVEGRLRTGDIDSICVLGCDDCSETLAVIPTRTAVAALIERNAELEAQTPSALREKLRSCEEALQAVEAERDALAAEVKALREDAGRWHEIAARYDAASGLQCANVLAAFGYPHDQPWFPLGHFVDAARASTATGED